MKGLTCEPRLYAHRRTVHLDHFAVFDRFFGVTVTTSLALIIALSALLWWKWDWFTAEFSDREIQKFFDDHDKTNT